MKKQELARGRLRSQSATSDISYPRSYSTLSFLQPSPAPFAFFSSYLTCPVRQNPQLPQVLSNLVKPLFNRSGPGIFFNMSSPAPGNTNGTDDRSNVNTEQPSVLPGISEYLGDDAQSSAEQVRSRKIIQTKRVTIDTKHRPMATLRVMVNRHSAPPSQKPVFDAMTVHRITTSTPL